MKLSIRYLSDEEKKSQQGPNITPSNLSAMPQNSLGSMYPWSQKCMICEKQYPYCQGHSGYTILKEQVIDPLKIPVIVNILNCFNINTCKVDKQVLPIGLYGNPLWIDIQKINESQDLISQNWGALTLIAKQARDKYQKEMEGYSLCSFHVTKTGTRNKFGSIKYHIHTSQTKSIVGGEVDARILKLIFRRINELRLHPIFENMIQFLTQVVPISWHCIPAKNKQGQQMVDSRCNIAEIMVRTSISTSLSTLQKTYNAYVSHFMSGMAGKRGRIRGNLMGKRVNMSARAVLIGDANLQIQQIGIPQIMAKRMKLKNNDVVMANRQPSLAKMSIMALYVVVHEKKENMTLSINPIIVSPFAADFDGDTISLHGPGNDAAAFEMRCLMMPDNNTNIIDAKSATTLIGVHHDGIIGIFLSGEKGCQYISEKLKDMKDIIYQQTTVQIINSKVTEGSIFTAEHLAAGKSNGLIKIISDIYGCRKAINFIQEVHNFGLNYLQKNGFGISIKHLKASFEIMVNSGAKGTQTNMEQMFTNEYNFVKGLDAMQYHKHNTICRTNLYLKATNVAKEGYQSRRMVKSLENFNVLHGGCIGIMGKNPTIISFAGYYEPTRMNKIKDGNKTTYIPFINITCTCQTCIQTIRELQEENKWGSMLTEIIISNSEKKRMSHIQKDDIQSQYEKDKAIHGEPFGIQVAQAIGSCSVQQGLSSHRNSDYYTVANASKIINATSPFIQTFRINQKQNEEEKEKIKHKTVRDFVIDFEKTDKGKRFLIVKGLSNDEIKQLSKQFELKKENNDTIKITANDIEESIKITGTTIRGIRNVDIMEDGLVVCEKESNTCENHLRKQHTNAFLKILMMTSDPLNTTTNNYHAIQKILGIEAANTCIVQEMENALPDIINVYHFFIADAITFTGTVASISSIGHQSESFLSAASFEFSKRVIINAATKNNTDNIDTVSANIAMGRIPSSIGTATIDLMVENYTCTNPYDEEKTKQYSENIMDLNSDLDSENIMDFQTINQYDIDEHIDSEDSLNMESEEEEDEYCF